MFGFGVYGGKLLPFFDPGPAERLNSCDWGVNGHTERLEEALAWVESLGVRIPAAGRHRQYLRFLRTADEAGSSSKFYERNISAINYARYEVHEFDRIRRWLGAKYDRCITTQLSEYVSGPYRYTEETKGSGNSNARDYGLELAIGSEFASIGLKVTYGDDLHPEPMLTIEGKDYAIQCKRASSSTEASLAKKISVAARQIRKNKERYSHIESGAIVLDVTKSLNPSGALHVNPTGQSQFCSMRQAHYDLSCLCQDLMTKRKNPDVSLLIVRATYLQSQDESGFSTQWICSKKYFPNADRTELFNALDRASPIAKTYGVGFGAIVDDRHDAIAP